MKNHCRFCYNTIYNPSPVSLLGNEDLIRRMGLARIRLQFTVEDAQQTEKVLEAFFCILYGREDNRAVVQGFLPEAILKRGVE